MVAEDDLRFRSVEAREDDARDERDAEERDHDLEGDQQVCRHRDRSDVPVADRRDRFDAEEESLQEWTATQGSPQNFGSLR